MNTPAVFGIVTAVVCVAIAVGVFLSWRFPHWGMHHTNNRPAPGVTEARYLQMYGGDEAAWTGVRRRQFGLEDGDDEFLRELLAQIRDVQARDAERGGR